MSFDEQPDAGPHDECAHEIARLTAECDELLRVNEEVNAACMKESVRADAAIQRAERAERVSVWAAIQGTPRPYGIGLLEIWDEKARKYVTVAHDKSAADIYRALVEACEGGDSNG